MTEVKGAEATIEIGDEQVVKTRESKKYRHPELDEKIRGERTEREYRIIKDARKVGANVPRVEKLDDHTLELEKLGGETLRESLKEELTGMEELGKNVARLHGSDIIHGDLTTSNALAGEDLHLIDFGLSFRSQRIEDRAVDIRLLKQVLESSHPGVAEKAWGRFLRGYRDYGKSGEVLERLEEVEGRGRYK